MNWKTALFVLIMVSRAYADEPPPRPWYKFGFELRGRIEDYTGLEFRSGTHDAYLLSRVRLNATFTPTGWLRGFAQVQDSRSFGFRQRPAPASMVDPYDIRQSWLEFGPAEGNGWVARAGRQPLVFGDMRLVSTSNWGNVGPAYDGLRLTYRRGKAKFDSFATALVPVEPVKVDRPGLQRRLHGFHLSVPDVGRGTNVETYSFWKHDLPFEGQNGRFVGTFGVHAFGKLLHGFDYNVETAYQTGLRAGLPVRAWAGHWETGWSRGQGSTAPRLSAEYNYASGDRDAADRRSGTFDNLYPTDRWGTADGFAWRNIHEAVGGVDLKPRRNLRIKVALHEFWLASRQDGLYSLAGAVVARNPTAPSARVGGEADVRATWQVNRKLQLLAGYGKLFVGPFLKHASPGTGTNFGYVMWSYTE